MENVLLLYLAQMINTRESLNEGFVAPTRWLCLRKNLQDQYLDEARKMVDDWWADEEDARQKREEAE